MTRAAARILFIATILPVVAIGAAVATSSVTIPLVLVAVVCIAAAWTAIRSAGGLGGHREGPASHD